MHSHSDHFKGKSAFKHLKDARQKGLEAIAESHALEVSGTLTGGIDCMRDTGFLYMLLSLFFLFLPHQQSFIVYCIFGFAWVLWKTSRAAILGWARLEKLHRLINEEKWEIEHHREQEKEELKAMYEAKGLKGKLLDDVVEILMSDDHRLLEVMLTEELGLPLESIEHPLRIALGAFIGALTTVVLVAVAIFFGKALYGVVTSVLLICVSTLWYARLLRNDMTKALVWALGTAFLIGGTTATLLHMIAK